MTLLQRPEVLRKYTREALRVTGWSVLRLFPRDWLLDNLPDADVRPGHTASPAPRIRHAAPVDSITLTLHGAAQAGVDQVAQPRRRTC